MKVLIYTAMHGRGKITELFALGAQRLIKEAPWSLKVEVTAVISDDESEGICEKNNFKYIKCENRPLGRKWNTGLNYFLQLPWDYVFITGDDDLYSSTIWDLFLPYMKAGADHFGLVNEYFLHPSTNEALIFKYGNNTAPNKLIGGGRMISRRAVEQAGWYSKVTFTRDYLHGHANYKAGDSAVINTKYALYLQQMGKAVVKYEPFFSLWKDYHEKGLDNECELGLIMNGFHPQAVQTEHPVLMDVKTESNIWQFDTLRDLGVPIDTQIATWFLSDKEKEFIKNNLT